jgi:hypothetical protein
MRSVHLFDVVGVAGRAGRDRGLPPLKRKTNLFTERLIDHQKLTGSTANLVHDTFDSASWNALAAWTAW